MNNNPIISVVIPTLGRTKELEDCLNTLSNQIFLDFEIILVTVGEHSLRFLIQKYNKLKISILQQSAKGLTSARNTGLLNAKGKIVSFIDDDVVVSAGWLQEIFDTFNKSPDIGGVSGPTTIPLEILANRDILAFQNMIRRNILWKIIGGIYTYFVLENQPNSIGRIFKSGAFSLGSNYAESTKIPQNIEVDYLEACNMSFKKEVLDKTGGFALEYKGVGDWSEPDLSFRVRKMGYKLIFNPKAQVNHLISQQGVYGERGKDSFQRAKNFIYFYFKWIKPDNLEKMMRFSLNLLFINFYWIYKFLQSRNKNWLSGINGTLSGLKSEIFSLPIIINESPNK